MIRVEHRDGVAVLAVQGRFTWRVTEPFKAGVSEVLAAGARCLVVDLSAADRVDSSGVGALLAALRRAEQAGASLRLACPDPDVRQIFELTRTHEILEIFDTVDEAADAALAAQREAQP